MKNLAVFGSTCLLGECILEAALNKGLHVRVLVKDPNNLPKVYQERVDVLEGDMLNVVDVKNTLINQDAAIVVLELSFLDGSSHLKMSEKRKNIIAVMEALGVRFVSFFLTVQPSNEELTIHNQQELRYECQQLQKALDSSGLHWIIVNALKVVDEPSTGYSIVRDTSPNRRDISKQDLGKFMLDSLSMPEHYQKVVTVCSNPRRTFNRSVLLELE